MMRHSLATLGVREFGNQASEVYVDIAKPKETTRM
jgi:hypothetical protein